MLAMLAMLAMSGLHLRDCIDGWQIHRAHGSHGAIGHTFANATAHAEAQSDTYPACVGSDPNSEAKVQ